MSQLQDIFARPIAHRGYHDSTAARLENTPSAVSAAMDKNFGIEVDVQETADGEALVFHDYSLDRLVQASGRVIDYSSPELTRLSMLSGGDKLWMLDDLFAQVDGAVPLVIEIKSHMKAGSQNPFVRRIVDQVAAYKGPACIKSFDPDMLDVALAHNPSVLRGIVSDAMRRQDHGNLSHSNRFGLRHILHFPRTRPHFISYGMKDLPQIGPSLLSRWFKLPIMAWTVKSKEDRERAAQFADQIVFEGFDPDQI